MMLLRFFSPLAAAAAVAMSMAGAPPAQANTAASFQRDLIELLECRASPAAMQAVTTSLRGALYGTPRERPAHLQGWGFTRSGDGDDTTTFIDMPDALTVHGITTHRVVADDTGFSIPVDAGQRARIVSGNGLRLRSSNLREPFQVWSAPEASGDASLPAALVVRSDGEGYRVGCDYPGPMREARVPPRLRETASASDVGAALECRADDAAMQRIANTWERVSELSPLAWPDNVSAVAEREYGVGGQTMSLLAVTLDHPVMLQGLPVQSLGIAQGGYFAADMGDAPLKAVLDATRLGVADRQVEGYWMREATREASSGYTRVRAFSVIPTDSGAVLAGCMTSEVRSAD
ncbi:hypothetical protein HH110_03050 [Stenotrophomonas sp. SAM-B]|uniref:hypothetical protein n=1 Tax=Stenotrophomonas sp. SAM-B TaxID=2729141 RepID=UPI0015A2BA88|nr:hypothetical protein [Stenotrophomonas sp. SAM-B]NWF32023.1 hypothetical protein [Stenotrophomonas sp. SAM-B]